MVVCIIGKIGRAERLDANCCAVVHQSCIQGSDILGMLLLLGDYDSGLICNLQQQWKVWRFCSVRLRKSVSAVTMPSTPSQSEVVGLHHTSIVHIADLTVAICIDQHAR